MTQPPSPEAVEALMTALSKLFPMPPNGELWVKYAERVAELVAERGFTITRAAMTDAELERGAEEIAYYYCKLGTVNNEVDRADCKKAAMALAKKYRG